MFMSLIQSVICSSSCTILCEVCHSYSSYHDISSNIKTFLAIKDRKYFLYYKTSAEESEMNIKGNYFPN